MHLGAGFGIFGTHLFHQSSKLTDLILQVTNHACSFTWSRRDSAFLRLAIQAPQHESRKPCPANRRNPETLHTSSYTSETRHLAKEETCPRGPDAKSNSEWQHPALRIQENAHPNWTGSGGEPLLGGRAA